MRSRTIRHGVAMISPIGDVGSGNGQDRAGMRSEPGHANLRSDVAHTLSTVHPSHTHLRRRSPDRDAVARRDRVTGIRFDRRRRDDLRPARRGRRVARERRAQTVDEKSVLAWCESTPRVVQGRASVRCDPDDALAGRVLRTVQESGRSHHERLDAAPERRGLEGRSSPPRRCATRRACGPPRSAARTIVPPRSAARGAGRERPRCRGHTGRSRASARAAAACAACRAARAGSACPSRSGRTRRSACRDAPASHACAPSRSGRGRSTLRCGRPPDRPREDGLAGGTRDDVRIAGVAERHEARDLDLDPARRHAEPGDA